MKLPYLENGNMNRKGIIQFKGLNQREVIEEGEFSAMENLSGALAPVFSPREKRRICHRFDNPHGLIGKDHLLWADGPYLYYNGLKVGDVQDNDKTFVGMAGYVVIYPDQLIFNTVDHSLTKMNHHFTSAGQVTYTLCDETGKSYDYVVAHEPPESPENGAYWLDVSLENASLKQYSGYLEDWQNVLTTYVKIGASGIGSGFKPLDGVKMTGSVLESLAVNEQEGTYVVLQATGEDFVVVIGMVNGEEQQETPITLERTAPDMDMVIEANNRLWGCSSKNHEIYASKLGDPTNWQVFEGKATDSYAATIESDGAFTGIFGYLGMVLFFKEHHLHKAVSSSWPPHIASMPVSGVQAGCEKSLALVGQTLFYKSLDGVMAYSGGLPQLVSMRLGTKEYRRAVAGGIGYQYYLSMEEAATGKWGLFVYDLLTDLWHREDGTKVKWFARCVSDLFFIGEDNVLYAVTRNQKAMTFAQGVDEEDVHWQGDTGDLLQLYPDHQFISKLQLKADIPEGGELEVWLSAKEGEWKRVYSYENKGEKRGITIPITPVRSNYLKLRLKGRGQVKLYCLYKLVEQGSELG